MIGLPPIGTVGVKIPQSRDRPKPKVRRFVGHDLELTEAEMKGADRIKIAWADKVADATGRDERTGRFVSLKEAK